MGFLDQKTTSMNSIPYWTFVWLLLVRDPLVPSSQAPVYPAVDHGVF